MNNQDLIGKRIRILPIATGIAGNYIGKTAIVVREEQECSLIYAKLEESPHWEITLCSNGHYSHKQEFEIVMNKTIDKNNWCIKLNSENTQSVKEFFNNNSYYNYWSGHYFGVENGIKTGKWNPHKWGIELTFEEFKQYILQDNDNQDFEGYIAPQDLFGGAVKKGDLYVYRTSFEASQYRPVKPQGCAIYTIPKEIVETWEKSYRKKEFIVKVAGNDVKVSKEGIFAEGAKIEERELLNIITLGGNTIYKWNIHLINATYKVGCWENVKLSEIKEVLAKYNEVKE